MTKQQVLPLLGGDVGLGMLYNAKEDKAIIGQNLFWNLTYSSNDVVGSRFKVMTERKLSKRLNNLDIDASLSMSFMAGLIEVLKRNVYIYSHLNMKLLT